jgi:hypothetical protein
MAQYISFHAKTSINKKSTDNKVLNKTVPFLQFAS